MKKKITFIEVFIVIILMAVVVKGYQFLYNPEEMPKVITNSTNGNIKHNRIIF